VSIDRCYLFSNYGTWKHLKGIDKLINSANSNKADCNFNVLSNCLGVQIQLQLSAENGLLTLH
jgi:hypothetical protein